MHGYRSISSEPLVVRDNSVIHDINDNDDINNKNGERRNNNTFY